jgi:hypothetical protein
MSFNPPVVYKLCRDCLHKTVTSANTGNVIHRVINLFSFIADARAPFKVSECHRAWPSSVASHARNIIGIDFFTVTTATFRTPYCYIILSHERQ